MKKLYIAPEMEIKKFSVEDIMTSSSNTPQAFTDADVATAQNGNVSSVEYSELFGI